MGNVAILFAIQNMQHHGLYLSREKLLKMSFQNRQWSHFRGTYWAWRICFGNLLQSLKEKTGKMQSQAAVQSAGCFTARGASQICPGAHATFFFFFSKSLGSGKVDFALYPTPTSLLKYGTTQEMQSWKTSLFSSEDCSSPFCLFRYEYSRLSRRGTSVK